MPDQSELGQNLRKAESMLAKSENGQPFNYVHQFPPSPHL